MRNAGAGFDEVVWKLEAPAAGLVLLSHEITHVSRAEKMLGTDPAP